jgi:uncharacterized membrane protein
MRVDDQIYIEAPTDVVWAVTADVERWPEWTPTVTSVKRVGGGRFGLGSVARVKQPAQAEAAWTVTAFEPGRRFVWESRRAGVWFVGSHEMTPEGTGTRNALAVEAGGLLAVLLWPLLRPAMRRALSQENRGLKAHCEAHAASGPPPEAPADGAGG